MNLLEKVLLNGGINLRVIAENLQPIHDLARKTSASLGHLSPGGLQLCMEEIYREALNYHRFTKEEIEPIMNKQLSLLSERLNVLIEAGDIEEKAAYKALNNLKRRQRYDISKISEMLINTDKNTHCLPVMPVIGTNVFSPALQMKLIGGEFNILSPERIKSEYGYCLPKESYWVVDVQIHRKDTNYSHLAVEEAIALALHSNILDIRDIHLTQSRRWHGINDWELMLTKIDGIPTLCKRSSYEGMKIRCKPTCFFRSVY